MAEIPKWKQGLLATGISLKFEASKAMVSEGFAVHADYRYARAEEAAEASVDLHGLAHTPFGGEKDPTAQVELLVACAHRGADALWLFTPDPNDPEDSRAAPGRALRVMDKFSPFAVESDAAADFESGLPVCQEGLEIDTRTGETDSSAFRGGLSRLRDALPRLFTDNVSTFFAAPQAANLPFLFCPILVTTARLMVMDRDLDVERLAAAGTVDEIAAEAPCLVMFTGYGPGFEAQCRREAARLQPLLRVDKAQVIEQKQARYYNSQVNLPFTIIGGLLDGDRFYMENFFTQFLVCGNAHFPILLDRIKETAAAAVENRKWID